MIIRKLNHFLVATQLWIDKIRKNQKLSFDETQLDRTFVESDLDYIQKIDKDQLLQKIIESIGEKCSEIIKQVYFSGYDMKEIASLFNFSNEDSAKTQHYRCKQKLIKKYRNNTYLKELLLGNK